MSQTILAQNPAKLQTSASQVYEYALTVINLSDKDTQELVAAFPFLPTLQDWQVWLCGWHSCGYSPSSEPQLIRII